MRTSIIAVPALAIPVLLLAASVSSQNPAAAREAGRWCFMGNDPGYVDCSQPSFEMCLFSTFGEGGHCYLDGAARAPYREAVNYRPREAVNYGAREAVNYRARAYVDPMGWSSNWNSRPQPAYAARPTYQTAYYQPRYQGAYYQRAYYERASYQPAYEPTYYQPTYYQPGYMDPYPARTRSSSTRWCYMGNEPGTVNCSQPSYEMCLFSTFGNGGHCYQEQTYWGPSRVRAAGLRPHHFHHRAPRVAEAASKAGSVDVANAQQKSGAEAYAMADSNTASDATVETSPVRAAAPITAAALKDFPKFNVAATCREAAHIGLDPERDAAVCLQDEGAARDQLVQAWNGFPADDRSSCRRLTSSTGGGTYTELATCLEMRQFARGANKDTSTPTASR